MKKITILLLAAGLFVSLSGIMFSGCTKKGDKGDPGTNGVDANQTCKECHSPAVVDKVSTQFELAKHSWGTVSFEEAGNTGCSPCHCQEAFVYVSQNNIPATFTLTNGKWVNNYASVDAASIGAITCFTCHSSLHTTYGYSDLLAFTTTAPVSMTMWGGQKTIDLQQDSAKSNLCVKCHEPRPLTCGNDPSGRLFPYDSCVSNPTIVMYDSTKGAHNIYAKPSYRMHVHYGAVGAVFAGMGGIEFTPPGGMAYGNSKHTSVAACPDCHMAEPMTGMAGGHAFNVRNAKESALSASTTWNFNGCNAADACHKGDPMSATAAKFVNTRIADKLLLDTLAACINRIGSGHNILHADASSTNLWWGVSSGNFDGYLDIYTPGTNDNGYWADPYLKNNTINNSKPKFPSLTLGQTGALINFQFCLREYSLGVHNNAYTTALLTNSIKMFKGKLMDNPLAYGGGR